MSVLVTTRSDDLPDDAAEDTADHLVGAPFPAANGKLVRLPTATAAPEQRVLAVEFRSPEGRALARDRRRRDGRGGDYLRT
jgi:hypothetical protein